MEENKSSHEIDIIALLLKVLKEWKTLCCFCIVFGILGLIVALCTPKTYTSEVILAPEMSSGGLGMSDNLADMASTFGIDLGSKSSIDAIYPEIYPDIFSSVDFMYSLFDVKVRLADDNTERTYIHHFRKETKIPFWQYPKMWIVQIMEKKVTSNPSGKGGVDPFRMSKMDLTTCQAMSKLMTCLIDKKTSEITISVTDQDAMVAAIMADTLQRRLQAYITDYRTKKARNDFEHYDKLMKDAESRYNRKQSKYVDFSDGHRNSILEATNTKEQALKEEMTSAYQNYATMSQMREQALAKIQERTPAFTVIQSAKMPYQPSSTPKIVTMIFFVILGCILDAFWVLFGKSALANIKKNK